MPKRDAVTRSIMSETALAPGLLVRSDIFKLRQFLELGDKAIGPVIELIDVRIFERVLVLSPADTVIHGDVLHRLHVELHAVDIAEASSAACE